MPVQRTLRLNPPAVSEAPTDQAPFLSQRKRGGPSGSVWKAPLGWLSSPYLLLVLTMLFWSGNWIFGRVMREDLTPIALAYWRWLIALIVFYPFALRHLHANHALIFRHWKLLLLFAALGVVAQHVMVYMALRNTTVTNCSLVISAMPIIIIGLSWLLLREKANIKQVLGILISLVGVVIIIVRGDVEVLHTLSFNKGDLWALGALPVWGLYTVLLRRRPAELHPLAFLGAIMIMGVLLLTPLFFWELFTSTPPLPSPRSLLGLGYVALFPSVLAYILWNWSVERVGPNKAGQFVHLLPFFATGLAVLLLGEQVHLFHILGALLIFSGIFLATFFGVTNPGSVPGEARR